jgi:hypothetical protein
LCVAVRPAEREVDVHEHSWLEYGAGIVDFEADLERSRGLVEERLDVADAGLVLAASLRQRRSHHGPGLDVIGHVLEEVGEDPDAGEIRDPEQFRPLVEALTDGDVAGEHEPGRRGDEPDLLVELQRPSHHVELGAAHAEIPKGVHGLLDAALGDRELFRGLLPLVVAPQRGGREDIGLFRAQELRRIERSQPLVLADDGAGGDRADFLGPPIHGGIDAIRPGLVGRDSPDRPHDVRGGRHLRRADPHADQLLTCAVNPEQARGIARCRGIGHAAIGIHRFEAHAARGALPGPVGVILRVHGAGVVEHLPSGGRWIGGTRLSTADPRPGGERRADDRERHENPQDLGHETTTRTRSVSRRV